MEASVGSSGRQAGPDKKLIDGWKLALGRIAIVVVAGVVLPGLYQGETWNDPRFAASLVGFAALVGVVTLFAATRVDVAIADDPVAQKTKPHAQHLLTTLDLVFVVAFVLMLAGVLADDEFELWEHADWAGAVLGAIAIALVVIRKRDDLLTLTQPKPAGYLQWWGTSLVAAVVIIGLTNAALKLLAT